jgi:hypothetical protein
MDPWPNPRVSLELIDLTNDDEDKAALPTSGTKVSIFFSILMPFYVLPYVYYVFNIFTFM